MVKIAKSEVWNEKEMHDFQLGVSSVLNIDRLYDICLLENTICMLIRMKYNDTWLFVKTVRRCSEKGSRYKYIKTTKCSSQRWLTLGFATIRSVYKCSTSSYVRMVTQLVLIWTLPIYQQRVRVKHSTIMFSSSVQFDLHSRVPGVEDVPFRIAFEENLMNRRGED